MWLLLKRAAVQSLAAALVILPATVWAGEAGNRSEIIRLREVLRGIVSDLALAQALDSRSLDDLRDELAQVYRDLDALADSWEYGLQPVPVPEEGWQAYPNVSQKNHPPDAEFEGWNKNADIDLAWGEYGEMILKVANAGYAAECQIHDAYHGNVQSSLRTETDGNVIIKVQDELGTHEFKVEHGGLGPVFLRGRDNPLPTKQTQPLAAGVAPRDPLWYTGYRDLVAAGQLGTSTGMEWLIDQYDIGDYENYPLEKLGSRLANLAVRSSDSALATLAYQVNGTAQEVEIPDPRFNPAGFVHTINILYNLVSDGTDYELRF